MAALKPPYRGIVRYMETVVWGDLYKRFMGGTEKLPLRLEFNIREQLNLSSIHFSLTVHCPNGGESSLAHTVLRNTKIQHVERMPAIGQLRVWHEQGVNLALQVAPHIYEHDPRIGMDASKYFPKAPLFDRPSGLHESQHKRLNTVALSGLTCCICSSRFSSSHFSFVRGKDGPVAKKGIIWGGGNLLWVHSKCHDWLKDGCLGDPPKGDSLIVL
jgi:hypothetical protein